MPTASDDGDLPWSENNCSGSDDRRANGHAMLIKNNPTCSFSWIDHRSQPYHHESTEACSQAWPLSPVSTGIDIPAPVPASEASGSLGILGSSLSTGGTVVRTGVDIDVEPHVDWEHCGDDKHRTLKLEPPGDDEFRMEDVMPATAELVPKTKTGPNPLSHQIQTPQVVRRPRGRPRKHLNPQLANANKVSKGRSKTGCITCRKRKKKCDEAKPRCKSLNMGRLS